MKEYYYDPNAPKPTRLVNMVEVAVLNGNNELLMIQKKGENIWRLPKGEVKIGESIDSSAMELLDHSLWIETAEIIALYSNPHIIMEDEENHSVSQEIVTLFFMKEMLGEKQKDTENLSYMWVKLDEVGSLKMPYSVRLHMRDVVNYVTKKRKNIRANEDDKFPSPSCYLLKEEHMTQPILDSFKRRNKKTVFVDAKEIKNILDQCKDEEEREKTIKKWCNTQHGIVFENFDYCFGDTDLQRILLRVVSVRQKRMYSTELITYQSIYDNADIISDELYMVLVASFYKRIGDDYELDLTSKFITRYCKR